MKKFAILLIALLSFTFSSLTTSAHKVENVRIKQLKNKISILYDITGEKIGEQFHIKAFYSKDGGETFEGPLDSLKGDFGSSITGGTDKAIVWNVLSEVPNLIGENIVFKIVAEPEGIVYPSDNTGDFDFQLTNARKTNNQIELSLKITNTSDERDLKIPNRLARLYDFNNEKLEAYSSSIGSVRGSERYSQPQVTFSKNQTHTARFVFRAPDVSSDRMKVFQLGFDIMKITHGLDLTPGKIEFRDFPITNGSEEYITENLSKPQNLKIGEKISQPADNTPPQLAFNKPNFDNSNPPLISESKLEIRGNAKDESGIFNVKINNVPVELKDDGSFTSSVKLKEGFNEIIVNALDIEENSVEKKYMVLHLPSEGGKEKLREIASREAKTKQKLSEGTYYALIIGENEYEDPLMTDLDKPIDDAQSLYETLVTHYAFQEENIMFLKNATRQDIMIALDNLNSKLKEKDNLLIFYAGHGYWDAENEVGYWLPIDSKHDNTAHWFRNSTLREYIHSFDSKHTLVIADACFSGSIFKTRKAFANAPQTIQNLYKYPSRKAMTSGNLKEVPDQSIFLEYLVKRLTENQKQYLTTEELFNSFKVAVMNNSPNVPQYGEIKNSGDEGGDFIFLKKDMN